jgi:hypothetical protein
VDGGGVAAPSYWCVDPAAPGPCGELGEKTAAARLLSPGRCNAVLPESPPGGVGSLLVDRVAIGAFATDVVYRARPEGAEGGPPGRLFVPVRGDDTLHWVDVTPGSTGEELECGQGSDQLCDDNHRRGDDSAAENTRDVTLPPEPFGVAVDERGESILMTHQTTGSVSLFVNDWARGVNGGPRLEHVRGDLPSGAVGVAAVPRPRAAPLPAAGETAAYRQSFLVTFRTSPEVHLVRYVDEPEASPERPYAEVARVARISTNSEGYNSRGIALDASRRQACEEGCIGAADEQACFLGCSALGFDVYVANRSPATVIVGGTRVEPDYAACLAAGRCTSPPSDLPRFFDAVPLSFGPSRVVMGNVRDVDGTRVPRVFVVCFDSKQVFVYDPKLQKVEAIIRTGRGPQSLAVDDGALDVDEAYGYVAHFTDSYIGVVDLNRGRPTYGQIILTLGEPSPPRASK